jgi:hypothetical protein
MLQSNLLLKSLSALILASGGLSAFGQSTATPSVTQDAKNSSCSNIVALAGNVEVNCSSLTPAQKKLIESIPGLLHKIIADQLDPQVVMTKLDEIIANQKLESAAIEKIQQQGWRRLTDQEIDVAVAYLAPFPGTKVRIEIPNSPTTDREELAKQLALIFGRARWDLVGTDMTIELYTGNFPHGVRLHVGRASEAAKALGNMLFSLFGRDNVPDGFLDPKFKEDWIEINIWPPVSQALSTHY